MHLPHKQPLKCYILKQSLILPGPVCDAVCPWWKWKRRSSLRHFLCLWREEQIWTGLSDSCFRPVPTLFSPFPPTEPLLCTLSLWFPIQVGGAAVLGVGVWTLVEKSDYLSLLASGTFAASACILVVAGSLVVVTGFLGCCAVIREQRSCLSLVRWTTVLQILTWADVNGGLGTFLKDWDAKKQLNFQILITKMALAGPLLSSLF